MRLNTRNIEGTCIGSRGTTIGSNRPYNRHARVRYWARTLKSLRRCPMVLVGLETAVSPLEKAAWQTVIADPTASEARWLLSALWWSCS